MEALIEPLFAALLGSGPAGLVAAFEFFIILGLAYAVWFFVKQRNGQAALTRQHSSELKKVQEAHIEKITELHESHQKQLTELNTARIADLKELNGDYSELAEDLAATMTRLTLQLEIRGQVKGG